MTNKIKNAVKFARRHGFEFEYLYTGGNVSGIMLLHESYGPYLDASSSRASLLILEYGKKHGYRTEQRLRYNATAMYV